jgi:hypothetical protein
MKIKIISDGTSLGTKIIDEATGTQIMNCSDLIIKVSAKTQLVECTMTLIKVPFEYKGVAETNQVII